MTLRFDNGFMRLLDKAEEIGIVPEDKISYLKKCREDVYKEIERIKETKVSMKDANELLEKKGVEQRLTKGVQANELLKFKEVSYDDLAHLLHIPEYPEFVKNQIETMIKYEVFIEREREQIERFKRLEALSIPEDFDFDTVTGISNIAKAGLKEIKPLSIGEASRISGVTGNDIALLLATLKK